jgi:tetratricopeptide (TPR) repeat protein
MPGASLTRMDGSAAWVRVVAAVLVLAPGVAASAALELAAPAGTGSPKIDPAIAELDRRIVARERLIRGQGARPSPTDLEMLALLYLERVELSDDYEDYARAEAALDTAVKHAPPGTGPLLARAQLNYTVHRLARAAADVDGADKWVIKSSADLKAIATFRANIAFHSGDYARARKGYEKDLEKNRSPAQAVALAQLEWKTGRIAKAVALFAKARAWAAETGPAKLRAWVALSEGIMELDRGRFQAALARFDEGLTFRPGFWVLQDHRAEALVGLGREAEALPIYLDLIARTQNPEFMDAAASIYDKRGDAASAQRLVREARVGYEKRLAKFPEATAGHALEFFLRHDPAAALSLAELNARARPGGEAQVVLAEAYLRNGRLGDARRVVSGVLKSPWRTADLHVVAAEIFNALGERSRASQERKRALGLNPHAFAGEIPATSSKRGG